MTKISIEFKIVKDLNNSDEINYYVYSGREIIAISKTLRRAMKALKAYIKADEARRKNNFPQIVHSQIYSYDK